MLRLLRAYLKLLRSSVRRRRTKVSLTHLQQPRTHHHTHPYCLRLFVNKDRDFPKFGKLTPSLTLHSRATRVSGSPFLVARQTTTDHISDPSCTMSAGGDELPAARPLSTSVNNELINPLHDDATAKATRTRAASCGVQGLSPSLSPPVGRAHSARSNSRSERSERVKRLTSLKNVSAAAVAAQQDYIGRSTPTCTHHPPSTTQVTIEMADTAQSSSFAASVSSNGYKRSTSGGRPGSDSETKTDDTSVGDTAEGSTRQKATPDKSLPRRHTVDIPRGTAVISFPRFLRAAENYHGVTA